MIPVDHKSAIINAGVYFIRSITEAYGADEGIKLWEGIADTLDPDLKGEIFFAMVTGDYADSIHVAQIGHDRVATIRAFRAHDTRRLGLKEAKELSDLCQAGQTITLQVNPRHRAQIEKELVAMGCKLV